MEEPNKHSPKRMCVTCRKSQPKSQLLRIVKLADGTIKPDKSGKAEGRGTYICNDAICFKQCVQKRGLNRAFKCNISEDVYKQIEESLIG